MKAHYQHPTIFSVFAVLLGIGLCLATPASVDAQEGGLFSGAGIRELGTPKQEKMNENKTWPNLFQRNRDTDAPRKPLLPKLDIFKPASSDYDMDYADNSRPPMFGGLPRLFPERDPNRPGFFKDLNARTKAFFDRSSSDLSGWASRTNKNAKNRTFETWDSITRGLKRPFGKPEQPMPLNQPPLRSAQKMDDQPSVKF